MNFWFLGQPHDHRKEMFHIFFFLDCNRTKNWHWYHLIFGVWVEDKDHDPLLQEA
eukprot:12359.XXX_25533_25697_1 [CDS] Oithona nana genome sequencing.